MAEFRQHENAQWIRTVRVNNLPSTKTVMGATFTQNAGPGVLTHGAATTTASTAAALIGTATLPGEYETLVLVTLSSGEILDTTFVTEVYD